MRESVIGPLARGFDFRSLTSVKVPRHEIAQGLAVVRRLGRDKFDLSSRAMLGIDNRRSPHPVHESVHEAESRPLAFPALALALAIVA